MTDRSDLSREQLLALVDELEAQYRALDLACMKALAEQSERFLADVKELEAQHVDAGWIVREKELYSQIETLRSQIEEFKVQAFPTTTNVEATYAPMEEWRFKLAYLDPDDQAKATHVCAGIWQDQGWLAYTLHELEVEQHDPTETRGGTNIRQAAESAWRSIP